jgi:predicted amidohydrolase
MSSTSAGPALGVVGVQCDIAWEDRAANLRRLAPRVAAAAEGGAGLVLLPEMFATGFSMDTATVAEPADGPTAAFVHERSDALGVAVGGSFACRLADGGKPVNRFLIARPGEADVVYDKVHPFGYGGEAEHYRAGSQLVTATIGGVRVTPMVCYDLRFADAFWGRAEATDCYVVVASWPASRQAHWRTLLVARAIENLAAVVGVNRVGAGGGVAYAGGSIAVGPFGAVVDEAGDTEAVVSARVDPAEVRAVRERYPFLADRRPLTADP